MGLAAVKQFLDSPRVNFWGAVFGCLAEVVSWTSTLGSPLFGRIAFGLTVFFFGRLAYVEHCEAAGYRAKFEPRFRVQFDPADRTGTYIQRRGSAEGLERRYRICVVNESAAELGPLHAVIAATDASDEGLWLDRRLHPMGEPRESQGQFTLSRDGRRFVEVLQEWHFISGKPSTLAILYNSEDLTRPLKTRDFHLSVQVEGGNAPAQRIELNVGRETFADVPVVRNVD
jgi:hypothetical protein